MKGGEALDDFDAFAAAATSEVMSAFEIPADLAQAWRDIKAD